MFFAGFISGSCDFTTYFHLGGVARATFDRNLIHSVDTFFLVMVRAGFFFIKSRVRNTPELKFVVKSHER